MNKNYLYQKQPSCLATLSAAASPETNHSLLTTHHSPKRKLAFTLAEVLITLGIIGIIAALTMPSLVNKINKKHWITGYKKTYSELSQVHQLLNSESGDLYMAECRDFDDVCLRDLFAAKMKVIESCHAVAPNKCQANSTFLNGAVRGINNTVNINASWPAVVTASGYSVKFRFHISDCAEYSEKYSNMGKLTTCGWVQIDVNGLKKPNVVGKDIYFVNIYKNKLVPLPTDQRNNDTLKEDCEHGEGVGCSTIYLQE